MCGNLRRCRTQSDNAEDVLPPLSSSAATHDCGKQRLGAAVEQRCEDTDNVVTNRTLQPIQYEGWLLILCALQLSVAMSHAASLF